MANNGLRSISLVVLLFVAQIYVCSAGCAPQVTASAADANTLMNPSTTSATFWSISDEQTSDISVQIPTQLPLQLQVLLDTNGLTLSSATNLITTMKQAIQANVLFGSDVASKWNVSVRVYAEQAATSGPVLQLGGGSVFNSDVQSVVEAISATFLLANGDADSAVPQTAPSSTPASSPVFSSRLLDLAAEIVSAWPLTQASSTASQVLIIFAPNDFSTSSDQWSAFEAAIRSASILPIFYSPLASPAWQSSLSSRWLASFPGSTVPAYFGTGQTALDAWSNFNLAPAVSFAKQLLVTGGGSPVLSDSSTISILSDDTSVSGSARTISINLALDASVTPTMAPNTSTIRVLGLRPVEISTRLAIAPVGSSAVATIQSLNNTALTLPVGNDTTQVILSSLPTQGQLYTSGGASLASTGTPISVDSLTYQPNSYHLATDSLTYSIIASCGTFGPYTLTLNLSLVPIIPIATDSSISLTEDDLSNYTVNLASLVSQTSASATITLLSLPTMIGTLKAPSTGVDAQLGVAYPVSSALWNFRLHGRYRGPRFASLQYVLDNGLGATTTGVFNITVTDVEHDPAWAILKTSVLANNYLLIRDLDNTTMTVTVSASASIRICQWFENNYSTCYDSLSQTFSGVQSPAIFSVGYMPLVGLTTATVTVTATDPTGRFDTETVIAQPVSLIAGLLNGLLGLVGGLLSALVGGSTTFKLVPNVPNGATVNNCFFAGTPTSATLTRDGSSADTNPWSWNPVATNEATYTVFPGVSGYDDLFFQCTYNTNYVSGIQRWNPRIPITTPTASPLVLTPTPDAPFTFIPIQGLVSEGSLFLSNMSATGGSFQIVQGGIKFFNSLINGQFAYTLCSTLNSSLCSGLVSNTITTISSLPLLSSPSQTFVANLSGVVNSFQIAYAAGSPPDGIIIHGIGLLSVGTIKVNGNVIGTSQLGQYWPATSFTFEFPGQLPITSKLLPMCSFTYTLVRNGKQSLPGTVVIMPLEADLLPLLPPVGTVVSDLVSTLTTTLDGVVTTLVPGFRVELDVFGKKSSQNSYQELLDAATSEGNSATLENPAAAGIELTAVLNVPRVGQLEICDSTNVVCNLANYTLSTTVTVNYNQTVYFTPPLLTALNDVLGLLHWTLHIVDSLGRFVGQTVDGTLDLANDVVSDTLRLNVMENTSPALRLQVPGILRLLGNAGLDPEGCGEIPPSPLVCVGGEFVANETVVVDTTWTITVATTTVYSGDLIVSPSGSIVMHSVPPTGSSPRTLPYLNVAGDVEIEGTLVFALSTLELNSLIYGYAGKRELMANESSPYTVASGRRVGNVTSVTLQTETNCYSVTHAPGNNGRPTLTVTFSFNTEDITCAGVDNPANSVNPDGSAVLTPSGHKKWSRSQIIWVSCAAAGGFLLIVLFVVLALVFHFNAAAKRLVRPYSIRRHKGQMYRTQPSSEMAGSQGSSEMLCPEDLAGNGSPSDIETGTPHSSTGTASTDFNTPSSHPAGSALAAAEPSSYHDDGELDDTEDHAMPRSL